MTTVGFQEPAKPQKASINFTLALDSMDDENEDDLAQRIEDFKNDNPDEVDELKRCVAEVLEEAEKTAQDRLDRKAVRSSHATVVTDNVISSFLPHHAHTTAPWQSEDAREKNLNAFMSGLKDKNKRVVTRARSLARSLIDTICNCTTTVSNPLSTAATRLRRQQTAFERTERSSSTPRQQTRFVD
jgi:hypothetical protein